MLEQVLGGRGRVGLLPQSGCGEAVCKWVLGGPTEGLERRHHRHCQVPVEVTSGSRSRLLWGGILAVGRAGGSEPLAPHAHP